MNALRLILLALQYLPHVLTAVMAVEDVIGAGKGIAKKKLVLDSVLAVSKVAQSVPEEHVKVIGTLIDSTVLSLNTSGLLESASVARPMTKQ